MRVSLRAIVRLLSWDLEVTSSNPGNSLSACGNKSTYILPPQPHHAGALCTLSPFKYYRLIFCNARIEHCGVTLNHSFQSLYRYGLTDGFFRKLFFTNYINIFFFAAPPRIYLSLIGLGLVFFPCS